MPVIRSTGELEASLRERLVTKLAQELTSVGETAREPLIFENPIQGTDKFFAVVIWSEWRSVPWGQRSGIILDAYRRLDEQRSNENPRAPNLAISSGITWEEADVNAFFPFGVEPNARAGEVDLNQVREAMLQAGAFQTPSGVRLRFMAQEEAQRVWERLMQQLPNAHWSISRFVGSESER